jgi:deazaflavin-dependent oxidoreductase (nitroreductase family)
MKNTLTVPSAPTGVLKWAFLLPRYLYRWHLGWMLGHRCLMVTHIGRKTGRRRETVLEIVHYNPATHECIVVSGYGDHADWYRNIQAHPALEVQVGCQRYQPEQRNLSPEETLTLLTDYQHRHPQLFRLLLRILGYAYDGTPEGLRMAAQLLQGVAFRPQAEGRDKEDRDMIR